MLDVPQLLAFAIAWFGSLWGQNTVHEVVRDCHCNCTCEVSQAVCPEQASWFFEVVKGVTYLIVGFLVGCGYLVKAIFLGGQILRGWLEPSSLASGGKTTLGTPSTAPQPLGDQGGQRDLALHQLELVRQRRANRG